MQKADSTAKKGEAKWIFRVQANGMIAGIIKKRSDDDIDVVYEDGLVVEHQTMAAFEAGDIPHTQKSNIISFSVRKKLLGR